MSDRALIVSSRFPWPSITGDRIRAVAWLEALCPRAEVTLLAPPGEVPAEAGRFELVPVPSAPGGIPSAALRALANGLPATALLAAGRDWKAALSAGASARGPFTTVVVLLARLDPWVYRHLPPGRRVLDAIDSLAANLEERARAVRGLARTAWRWEARRTARLEREAGSRYDRVVVVADAERAAFGDRAVAISHGVALQPPTADRRDLDVGFWGRLAYFANLDAARFLLEEIWPRVRAARPAATLLLAGADAPRSLRRRDGRDGVTVVSPMTDRSALLRRVKVALLPLRFGSGQSNKVLEAAEASCALVATPEALRGLGGFAERAAVASRPEILAGRVLDLLADPGTATRQGELLRLEAELSFSREVACRRLAEVALG